MNDEEEGLCGHKGCQAEVTHCKSVWVNPEHLRIDYYCAEHAPSDAEEIEEEEDDS